MALSDWFYLSGPPRSDLKEIGINRRQYRQSPDFWMSVINEQRALNAWASTCATAGGRTIPERYRQRWFNSTPITHPHCAEVEVEGFTEPNDAVKEMIAWAHEEGMPHEWRWHSTYHRANQTNSPMVYLLKLRFYFADATHAVHFKMRWA